MSAPRRPVLVDLADVRDPDVEEGARAVWIGRGGQGNRGLVIGRAAALVEDQPGVGDLHDDGVALQYYLAVEDLAVKVAGPVLVGDHQELGDDEAVFRCRKVTRVHAIPPLVTPPAPADAKAWAARRAIKWLNKVVSPAKKPPTRPRGRD